MVLFRLALAFFTLSALALPSVAPAQDSPGRPVKIIEVAAAEGANSMRFPAVLQPAAQVVMTFRVSGRLAEFPVQEGMKVKKGDLIGRIDEPRYEAKRLSAQAEYDKAVGDLDRAEKLLASGSMNRRDFDTRTAAVNVALANLNAAAEDVTSMRLVAPFDGIVAKRNVEQFQNVNANEPIVVLQNVEAFDALVNVPSRAVLKGGRQLTASVIVDGLPGRVFPATLRSFSSKPDPETGTYATLLRIEKPADVMLLPGMGATVVPSAKPGADRQIFIPLTAIAASPDGSPFVWVVDGAGAVSKRPVTLGTPGADDAEVQSGLSEGERVVAAGLSQLKEGMVVRAWRPRGGSADAGSQGE